MLKRVPLLVSILLAVAVAPGFATAQTLDSIKKAVTPETPMPKDRAVINFANFHGTIQDWRADGTKAILIQDVGKKWYRAEFMSPCNELPFTERVGFITDSLDQIDRFSSIIVRGQRCWFKSFTETTAPTGSKSKASSMKEGAADMAKEKAKDMAKEKASDIAKEKALDSMKGKLP